MFRDVIKERAFKCITRNQPLAFLSTVSCRFQQLTNFKQNQQSQVSSTLVSIQKVHKDFPIFPKMPLMQVNHLSLFSLRFFGLFLCHSGKLGALRLKVRLVEDRILPSVYYQPLIDLLVESVISPTEVSAMTPPQLWYSRAQLCSFFTSCTVKLGSDYRSFQNILKSGCRGRTHFFCLQHTHTQIIIIIIHYRILLTHHLTSLLWPHGEADVN